MFAMRRRILLSSLLLAAIVSIVAVALAIAPAARSTSKVVRENYLLIHEGMTQAEVHAILGRPGFYATGETESSGIGAIDLNTLEEERKNSFGQLGQGKIDAWFSDSGWVMVTFDDSGKVVGGIFSGHRRKDVSVASNLIWRLKHWWRYLR